MKMDLWWIFWLIGVILMIWVIVDVLKSRMKNGEKAIWIVLAVFFNILTAIIYYFVKKK